MGDLNINYLKPNLIGCKLIKELCRDYNLTQLITEPTRITQATRTLLDLIITNMNLVQESGVLDYVISDHLPVFVIRKKQRILKEYVYTEVRNMKNYSAEDFCNLIHRDPRWLQYWTADTVTEMWEIMHAIIFDSLDSHLLKSRIRICVNNPEWFTADVLESITLKNRKFKKAKENPENYGIIIYHPNEIQRKF